MPSTPPTTSTDTQTTIEALKTTYKKRGHFDSLRKDLFARFNDSEAKPALLTSLERTVDREIDRDPSILARDRTSAARILEGVVERTHAYEDVERVLDELLAEKRAEIEAMIRAIMVAQGLSKASEAGKRERGREEEGKVEEEEKEEKKVNGNGIAVKKEEVRVSRWDIAPKEEVVKEAKEEDNVGRVEITPEMKVEITPEMKVEITPEVKVEVKLVGNINGNADANYESESMQE
ncbi:hypothetical protein RUND412_007252 [Rhizina undulata]